MADPKSVDLYLKVDKNSHVQLRLVNYNRNHNRNSTLELPHCLIRLFDFSGYIYTTLIYPSFFIHTHRAFIITSNHHNLQVQYQSPSTTNLELFPIHNMLFTHLPLVCLISSAFAAPAPNANIAARDIRVIEKSISNVQTSLKAMDAAVRSLSLNAAGNAHTVIERGNDLTATLKQEAAAIRKGPNVDYLEAMTLLGNVEGLAQATESTVRSWLSVKRQVIQTKGQDAVLRILRENEVAADEFTDAMVQKMPELAKYVGRAYGSRVKVAIDNAINGFRS